jgi:hypothetical protein
MTLNECFSLILRSRLKAGISKDVWYGTCSHMLRDGPAGLLSMRPCLSAPFVTRHPLLASSNA